MSHMLKYYVKIVCSTDHIGRVDIMPILIFCKLLLIPAY